MRRQAVLELLMQYREGVVGPDAVLEKLYRLPFADVEEYANLDHDRERRNGTPEVVFGEGKTSHQILQLLRSLAASGRGALATRVSTEKAQEILAALPEASYHPTASVVVLPPVEPRAKFTESIAVVCAGTCDLPVADEAAVVLEFLGHQVRRFTDVGIAGLHRVVSVVNEIQACKVVIVAAGMEGALPAVLSSLIPNPIIAVPTSVGYGVGINGYVAMMGMLASCSPGVAVVNIDNGFGAAVAAARILGASR